MGKNTFFGPIYPLFPYFSTLFLGGFGGLWLVGAFARLESLDACAPFRQPELPLPGPDISQSARSAA
eukprot:1468062-Amphidinium_carterae.1